MKDAIITIRIPAATKGRWIRSSRAEGKRLTSWIIEKVESTMGKTAQEIIDTIREAGAEDDQAIIYALEDGVALEALGITDADQEGVEEAHDMLKSKA